MLDSICIWIHPSIIFRAHCSVHRPWSTAVLPPPTSHSLACSTPELSSSPNSRRSPDPHMSTGADVPLPLDVFETEEQRRPIASHRVDNVAFQMTQASKQPHHTLPMLKIIPLVSSSLRVDARRPPSCSCQRLLLGLNIPACPEFSAKVVDSAYLPRLKVSTTRFFKIGPGSLERKTRLLRPSFFSMKRFGPRWTTSNTQTMRYLLHSFICTYGSDYKSPYLPLSMWHDNVRTLFTARTVTCLALWMHSIPSGTGLHKYLFSTKWTFNENCSCL